MFQITASRTHLGGCCYPACLENGQPAGNAAVARVPPAPSSTCAEQLASTTPSRICLWKEEGWKAHYKLDFQK